MSRPTAIPPAVSAAAVIPSGYRQVGRPEQVGKQRNQRAEGEREPVTRPRPAAGTAARCGSTPSSSLVCTRSAVSGSLDTAAAIRSAVSRVGAVAAEVARPARPARSRGTARASAARGRPRRGPARSDWSPTRTRPVPIENAPATSAGHAGQHHRVRSDPAPADPRDQRRVGHQTVDRPEDRGPQPPARHVPVPVRPPGQRRRVTAGMSWSPGSPRLPRDGSSPLQFPTERHLERDARARARGRQRSGLV